MGRSALHAHVIVCSRRAGVAAVYHMHRVLECIAPMGKAHGAPVLPSCSTTRCSQVLTTGQIETRVGEPLTVAEIETALRTERGEDIRVVPLAGRSDLADHMSEQRGQAARREGPAAVFSPLSRLQFL